MQQPLLQLLLISLTSTCGTIVSHNNDSQAENELSKRAVVEIESWEEAALLQMSAKFLPKRIRRVKRDDG